MALGAALLALLPLAQGSWTGWGGNVLNNRWAQDTSLSKTTVDGIVQHCYLGGFEQGVSAPPAIHGGVAYFTSWDGLITAYRYEDCEVVWQTNITAWLNAYRAPQGFQAAYAAPISRNSPQLDGEVLYVGTLRYALLLAMDRGTGRVLAHAEVNQHPLAMVTMSPTFFNGTIFVGASSNEELAASDPTYPCCSFAGNFAAFSYHQRNQSFTSLWNETMLPGPNEPGGWSGAAVWGSQPSIDKERSQVFIATGNVYEIPTAVQACINATGNDNETACYSPSVRQEAVISLDIMTGRTNWIRRLTALDAWTTACGYLGAPQIQPQCPSNPGPDADFGMAPTFVSGLASHTPGRRDVAIVGQKDGILYAFDAANGTVYWATVASPDPSGALGALNYGIAVDDDRAYFTAINPAYDTWTLQPSGKNISNAAYGAVNISDGSIEWEVANPRNGSTLAQPTVAKDLVVVGLTVATSGSVLFLDKADGSVIKEIGTDNAMYGGVAVEGEWVFFGSGYNGAVGTGSFNVWKVDTNVRSYS